MALIVFVVILIIGLFVVSRIQTHWLNIVDIYKFHEHAKLLEGRNTPALLHFSYRELGKLRDGQLMKFIQRQQPIAKTIHDGVATLVMKPEIIRWLLRSPSVFDTVSQRQRRFTEIVMSHAHTHMIAESKIERVMSDFVQKIVVSGDDFEKLGTQLACEIVVGANPIYNYDKLLSAEVWPAQIAKMWSWPAEHSLLSKAKVLYPHYHIDDLFVVIKKWIDDIRIAITTYVPMLFVLLYSHPEINDTIRKDSRGRSLAYLQCAIAECIRMYNIDTFASRTLICDVTIAENIIRENSQVLMPIVSLCRDRVCFPNHNTFDILRWENADARCNTIFSGEIQPAASLIRTIVKKIASDIITRADFEVLEPVVDRDNLPAVINPCSLRMGLKRLKAQGYKLRF